MDLTDIMRIRIYIFIDLPRLLNPSWNVIGDSRNPSTIEQISCGDHHKLNSPGHVRLTVILANEMSTSILECYSLLANPH